MANDEYTLSYSASEINRLLGEIDRLNEKIDSALAEAKANGEFKPVKEVDYWTVEDQESIVQQAIVAMGNPILGSVDNDNNVALSNTLAYGTYPIAYETVDGRQTKIGTILGGYSTFTNQLHLATDETGLILNGVGYQTKSRIGSSGGISSLKNTEAPNPAFATGFIPVKVGDVVRMSNCYWKTAADIEVDIATYGHDIGGMRVSFFDESKELLYVNGFAYLEEADKNGVSIIPNFITVEKDSDGNITTFTITNSSVGYFRTTLLGDPETAIVTVNELIIEDTESYYDDIGTYDNFIPQNVATLGARRIGVYNNNGARIGFIPIGPLTPPDPKQKLYSFGAISDIHLNYDTAESDFRKALTYLNDTEDVAFTCIAGDLTGNGTTDQLQVLKDRIATWSVDTPVYCVTGNHDGYNSNIENIIETYTGHPLYYSFEHDNDMFIMCGIKSSNEGTLFTTAELQWLYETLEANRNKRCFVFHHVRPQDGCGNAFGIYNFDIWGGTEATVFESLMTHYKNAHQFHGHSHLKFYLQYGSDIANIDHIFGGWSIHIPSLAVPRDGDVTGANSRQEMYSDSEGYVVDVYANGIHLRGRDFVKDEFLPIASYWLDTTIQPVEAGSYTDPTGTITV